MDVALPYRVVTGVIQEPERNPLSRTSDEMSQLMKWLNKHIGRPYDDWHIWQQPENNGFDRLGVCCRTAEQATLVALRWS